MPVITPARIAAVMLGPVALLALSGCAAPYTGPVEVTRFVSPDRAALGRGTIRVMLEEGGSDNPVNADFVAAVSQQLARIGYSVVPASSASQQTAMIRTSRQPIAALEPERGPVSVGVGGQTGSFGSGVGLGVGINLGGGRSSPNVNTELFVRINDAAGRSLWEGRAQLATAIKSPYSQGPLAARTLAAGLFKDFPGGNGETITIKTAELQPSS